jgi:hypothetical protein
MVITLRNYTKICFCLGAQADALPMDHDFLTAWFKLPPTTISRPKQPHIPKLRTTSVSSPSISLITETTLNQDPVEVARLCSLEHLFYFLPVLIALLCSTPAHYHWHRDLVVRAFMERAVFSAALRQRLSLIFQSGLIYNPSLANQLCQCVDEADFGAFELFSLFSKDSKRYSVGYPFVIPSHVRAFHPFLPFAGRLTKIVVVKVFNSNARPILLSIIAEKNDVESEPPKAPERPNWGDSKSGIHHDISRKSIDRLSSVRAKEVTRSLAIERKREELLPIQIIFKCGDDLRQDAACLQIFQMMNRIWLREGVGLSGLPVQSRLYGCISINEQMGCLEFLPDCVSLNRLKSLILLPQNLQRLIVSAAGSYIAAFIIGVCDRHHDNILVHKDGWLFHIDFGYILGNEVTLDTGEFAITEELKSTLGDTWTEFLDLAVKAFMALKKHEELLISFIETAMAYRPRSSNRTSVREYLRTSLMQTTADSTVVVSSLRAKLEAAPSNFSTIFKNWTHSKAVNLKE